MKKWLSIALLLFSVAAPSAIYSVGVPHNTGQTSQRLILRPADSVAQKANHMKHATLTRRFCAYLLQGLIVSLITVVALILSLLWFYYYLVSKDIDPKDQQAVGKQFEILISGWSVFYAVIGIMIGFFAVYIVCYLLLQLSRYILGIKVVDISGKEASFLQKMKRFWVKFPPLFLCLPLYSLHPFIGLIFIALCSLCTLIMMISTVVAEDGRGFPDKIANTVLVKVDKNNNYN